MPKLNFFELRAVLRAHMAAFNSELSGDVENAPMAQYKNLKTIQGRLNRCLDLVEEHLPENDKDS